MCTYETETIPVRASAKVADAWRAMDSATIYFDHPVHFAAGHALMIDVRHHAASPAQRVALELDANSARELAHAILRTLDKVPDDLVNGSVT